MKKQDPGRGSSRSAADEEAKEAQTERRGERAAERETQGKPETTPRGKKGSGFPYKPSEASANKNKTDETPRGHSEQAVRRTSRRRPRRRKSSQGNEASDGVTPHASKARAL